MEKQLKFFHLLPLQEMSMRRLATLLSSGADISASISRFPMGVFDGRGCESDGVWRENIEKEIKDKFLKFDMPELLKKQMVSMVRLISLEIKRWKRCNCLSVDGGTGLPDSARLCWTVEGTIDDRRTAIELMGCEKINVGGRFEIACKYGLEDYIPLLWERLSEMEQVYFFHRDSANFLKLGWPHFFGGQQYSLDNWERRFNPTFNQLGFEHAVRLHEKATTEFYFRKLTRVEKVVSLMRIGRYLFENPECPFFAAEKLSSTLCYLLYIMSPKQQMEAIKAHPLRVLLSFLHWSRFELFVENLGLIWPFLPRTDYSALLDDMIEVYNTYNFPKFFQEFLEQSPPGLKEFFFGVNSDYPPARYYLSTFFSYDDSVCVELMFRSMDAADRMAFATHRCVLTLFLDNMRKDRRHLVEMCLREAGLLSDEGRERLERACIEFGDVTLTNLGLTHYREKLQAFYDFLKEIDASAGEERKGQKRKLAELLPDRCPD